MINEEFEAELVKVRDALANSIACEKQIGQKLKSLRQETALWQKRVELAQNSDKADLALEAESRLQELRKTCTELEIELLSQEDFSAGLKTQLQSLEARRFSAGSSAKDALAACDSTLSTIERMEKKILVHETEAKLGRDDLGNEFRKTEAEKKLDDELEALKASINKQDQE